MAPVAPGATVAVTGATGFIGSHVCAELLSAGYRVRAVVRNPDDEEKTAHLKALPGAAERLALFRGRLDEPGSYDGAFAGADAVVHTAAVVEILDVKDPEKEIVQPSVEGTKNVLASADKSGTVKRFVHTSSELAAFKWDEALDAIFSEDNWNTVSTVQNGDPYGYAKATAEKMVLEHAGKGFESVSILPGINLGPCMTKQHTKSSAVVVRQILFGNRQADYVGQFVDVRDTAAAHVKALSVALPDGDKRRFLVVSDAGSTQVSALQAPLERLFPQYVMEAKPLLAQGLMTVPLLWRLAGSEFQNMIFSQRFGIDNSRSKSMLGLQYRSLDTTLEDTVKSMVDTGFVKARPK